MPDVDLAALSGPELRGLLGSARERGDAALSYEILKEMAARREPRPGVSRRRPRGEPRIVSVDLGDPTDRKDELPPMRAWRPPPKDVEAADVRVPPPPDAPGHPLGRAQAQPGPERAWPPITLLRAEDFEAMTMAAAERPAGAIPEPDRALGEPGPTVESLPAPRRHRAKRIASLAVSAAVGAAGGMGLGWFLGGMSRTPPSVTAPPEIAHAMTVTPGDLHAPASGAGGLAASPTPAPSQPLAAQAAARETELESPQPSSQEGDLSPPEPPRPPPATPAETPAARTNACTSEPTAADRTICGDPELRRLQRQLRQAYADALEAHRDKALLRQRQLAWREARNAITDPERLAFAYEQRIQQLKAATADARKHR
jgi:uncharacterized protein YecT (DUF1311 family)